jgi:DnaJ family protein C protein 8
LGRQEKMSSSSSSAPVLGQKRPAPPDPSSSSSSEDSSSEDEEDKIEDFLDATSLIDRKSELTRIEKAFKLNPLDILALPTNATVSEVKKRYRELSLMTHPDKIGEELRPRAQAVFSKLADAKTQLLDDVKRRDLVGMIVMARTGVEKEKQQAERKRRKELIKQQKADMSSLNEPYPAFAADPAFEVEVAARVKELLIDAEWKRRELFHEAQQYQKTQRAKKEVVVKEEEQVVDVKQTWEEGRAGRVDEWRKFASKKTKKKKAGFKTKRIRR